MVQIKSAGYRVQNLESNLGLNEGSMVHCVTLSKLLHLRQPQVPMYKEVGIITALS